MYSADVFIAPSTPHDDVIKWKHFRRCWPFVREIHRSLSQRPVTRSFDISLICAWINRWVNTGEAGDLRRHRARYDAIAMSWNVRKAWLCFAMLLLHPSWGQRGYFAVSDIEKQYQWFVGSMHFFCFPSCIIYVYIYLMYHMKLKNINLIC